MLLFYSIQSSRKTFQWSIRPAVVFSIFPPSEVYSLVLVGGVPPAFKFCRPPFLPQVSERAIPKSTQHSWIGMGRRLHFESEDYLPSRDSNWAQKNLKESEAAEGIGNRHFPLGSCFLILTSSSSPLSHMGNVKVETLIRKKQEGNDLYRPVAIYGLQ